MIRRGFALMAVVSVFASLNGCCSWRNREHPLLDRLRGKPATSYADPYYPGPMTGSPMMMPSGGIGGTPCCGGGTTGAPTFISGPGMSGGLNSGVIEQPPLGSFPGANPVPTLPMNPPAGDNNAKPLPAGPSGDMTKGSRPGRVTNLPDGK
jgi:hypothetical protein